MGTFSENNCQFFHKFSTFFKKCSFNVFRRMTVLTPQNVFFFVAVAALLIAMHVTKNLLKGHYFFGKMLLCLTAESK